MKIQHQRHDVWSTKFKAKEQLNVATFQRRDIATSRCFRNSCIIIIKSTGDPIFEVSSEKMKKSRTRSRRNPRDCENSCLCISLVELPMIYRTMLVITFIMF